MDRVPEEYVPAGHGSQLAAPLTEKVPAVQEEHALSGLSVDAEYMPAAQLLQTVAPTTAPPNSHVKQLVDPVLGW